MYKSTSVMPPSKKIKSPAKPAAEPDESTHVGGEGYRVVLFNDDVHAMDEVAFQVMKALGCPWDDAVHIMLCAHRNGSTTVTIASRTEANRVAGVLGEIGLLVQVNRV